MEITHLSNRREVLAANYSQLLKQRENLKVSDFVSSGQQKQYIEAFKEITKELIRIEQILFKLSEL